LVTHFPYRVTSFRKCIIRSLTSKIKSIFQGLKRTISAKCALTDTKMQKVKIFSCKQKHSPTESPCFWPFLRTRNRDDAIFHRVSTAYSQKVLFGNSKTSQSLKKRQKSTWITQNLSFWEKCPARFFFFFH
jgi:hypothetical protein